MIIPTSEAESKQLEVKEGFSHCGAMGIEYAVAKISKFSTSPACCHYKAIKQEPRNDLPEGAHIQ
eukprot:15351179-Ditylum_brightwellii.AAC.1